MAVEFEWSVLQCLLIDGAKGHSEVDKGHVLVLLRVILLELYGEHDHYASGWIRPTPQVGGENATHLYQWENSNLMPCRKGLTLALRKLKSF